MRAEREGGMIFFIFIVIGVWYASGVASFVYWWSHEWGNINGHYGLAAIVGLLGPFAFPLGYLIHG